MTFAFWIACFGAVFGLFFGLLFGLMSYFNGRSTENVRNAFIFVVATPIVFAVISLLASLTAATVYNAFVKHRGGMFFVLDLGSKADLPPPPPPPPSF